MRDQNNFFATKDFMCLDIYNFGKKTEKGAAHQMSQQGHSICALIISIFENEKFCNLAKGDAIGTMGLCSSCVLVAIAHGAAEILKKRFLFDQTSPKVERGFTDNNDFVRR